MKERRKARRFSVEWSVVVKGYDACKSEFEEAGSLINLSSRGAFVHLRTRLKVGKKVQVCIRLPLERARWMTYRAEVVRCEDSGTQAGVGIRFTTVHPKLMDAL